jgi:hypothetical protein
MHTVRGAPQEATFVARKGENVSLMTSLAVKSAACKWFQYHDSQMLSSPRADILRSK